MQPPSKDYREATIRLNELEVRALLPYIERVPHLDGCPLCETRKSIRSKLQQTLEALKKDER